jgi:hypothetical protein
MGNIVAFHPEEFVQFIQSYWKSNRSADLCSMDVVVQPSVSWMELNETIKDSGLFFPVDPGPPVSLWAATGIGSFSEFVKNLGENRRHDRHQLQVSHSA